MHFSKQSLSHKLAWLGCIISSSMVLFKPKRSSSLASSYLAEINPPDYLVFSFSLF